MRFQVLGPLIATGDDGPISLRAPKSRLLLAVLLSRAGQIVALDRLEDAVWSGEPPAAGTLRWHVHQLRARLGADRVVRQDGGLLLKVDDAELDAAEFERQVTAGGCQLREGRAELAGETLRGALDLWYGEAYDGLSDTPLIADEARRLQALRRTALEQRIAADLALGRHDELASELSHLVAEDPLRERLRALHITALLRSGHRAEALTAYDDARATLVRELGMEPGAELQRLHQELLQDQPTPATPAPPVRQGPAELPARLSTFTGRTAELTRLTSYVESGGGPVVVSGPGGVGKSALAVEAAHRVRGRFPDGQLYVELNGSTPGMTPRAPLDVLHRMLRSLGERDASALRDVDEAAARFRSATSERRLLVVLDNAADVAQVRPLLPGGTGSAVIVTSRRALVTLEGSQQLRLGRLPDEDARAMLTRLTGADRVAAEPEAAAEVTALCEHLPLAVAVAAARLAARPTWTLHELGDRLRDRFRRLEELTQDDRAVRASLGVSFDDLDPAPAGLLLRLALLEVPEISVPLAAAVADVSETSAAHLLEVLATDHLIEPLRSERFLLHDLTRLFALERAAELPDDVRVLAVRRGLEWVLDSTRNALETARRGSDERRERGLKSGELLVSGFDPSTPEEAIAWLDTEVAIVLAAAWQAVDGGADMSQLALGLAAAATPALSTHGMHHERLTLTAALLETAGLADAAWIHIDAANAYLQLADFRGAEAHGREAVHAYRELDDRLGIATAEAVQGDALRYQGKLELAVEIFRSAMAVGDADHQGKVAISCGNNLADTLMELGRFAEAVPVAEDTVARAKAFGQPRYEALLLVTLGEARLGSGLLDDAVVALSQAAGQLHDHRERLPEALARWRWGQALDQLGRADEAAVQWHASIEILRALDQLDEEETARLLASPRPEPPAVLMLPY